MEEELHRAFPAARIARLDRDTVTGKRQYETILNEFREGNYDVLVGTQMIAKGHDIPNVTLVGVVAADMGLGMPDFRAAERTFQLLTQVAGRAGRGNVPGIVLIQTINPDHYAVRMAAAQDYQAFYQKELHFPPHDALSALRRDGERPGAEREERNGPAHELGAGAAAARRRPNNCKIHGAGRGSRAAAEERVPVSISGESGQPQVAERAAAAQIRTFALEHKMGRAPRLVIDVDPLTLM